MGVQDKMLYQKAAIFVLSLFLFEGASATLSTFDSPNQMNAQSMDGSPYSGAKPTDYKLDPRLDQAIMPKTLPPWLMDVIKPHLPWLKKTLCSIPLPKENSNTLPPDFQIGKWEFLSGTKVFFHNFYLGSE